MLFRGVGMTKALRRDGGTVWWDLLALLVLGWWRWGGGRSGGEVWGWCGGGQTRDGLMSRHLAYLGNETVRRRPWMHAATLVRKRGPPRSWLPGRRPLPNTAPRGRRRRPDHSRSTTKDIDSYRPIPRRLEIETAQPTSTTTHSCRYSDDRGAGTPPLLGARPPSPRARRTWTVPQHPAGCRATDVRLHTTTMTTMAPQATCKEAPRRCAC